MKVIIKNLIFLSLVVLLILVGTTVVIGIGYLISLMFPLTLFQSSILCISSIFTLTFGIYAMGGGLVHKGIPFNTDSYVDDEESDEDDYNDDDEDTKEESNYFPNSRFTVVNAKKVGKNAPCPCGSGKKYKYCCDKEK